MQSLQLLMCRIFFTLQHAQQTLRGFHAVAGMIQQGLQWKNRQIKTPYSTHAIQPNALQTSSVSGKRRASSINITGMPSLMG
jgi:hypothetical protein